MNSAAFPFDRQFQIGILALMAQRYDFLLTAVDLFEPSYFEDKVLIWFFQLMKKYYLQTKEMAVVDPVITNEVMKATRSKEIPPNEINDYGAVCRDLRQRVNAQNYVINEVVRFCRRQAGRKIYLDTAPLMDTADDKTWDEIVDKISGIAHIGSSHLDMGSDYFATLHERLRRRLAGGAKIIVPVGITELDYLIGGGLKGGQLGMWLGGTGGGKSIALSHCGQRAVSRGFKVAHYTLELDDIDIEERYDAQWSQVPMDELSTNSNYVQKQLEDWDRIVQSRGGRLVIKAYPTSTATVNTIRTHLRQLHSQGWQPDLVIVDYLDLLKPMTNYQDEYADLGATAAALRGLAGELGIPIWSATQANRAGMQANVIDVEHIGDSLKKAQIADVILALCANREEIADNILRIFGAKNRNGRPKFEIKIKTAFDRMTLHDQMVPATNLYVPPSVPPPPMPGLAPRQRRAARASSVATT